MGSSTAAFHLSQVPPPTFFRLGGSLDPPSLEPREHNADHRREDNHDDNLAEATSNSQGLTAAAISGSTEARGDGSFQKNLHSLPADDGVTVETTAVVDVVPSLGRAGRSRPEEGREQSGPGSKKLRSGTQPHINRGSMA